MSNLAGRMALLLYYKQGGADGICAMDVKLPCVISKRWILLKNGLPKILPVRSNTLGRARYFSLLPTWVTLHVPPSINIWRSNFWNVCVYISQCFTWYTRSSTDENDQLTTTSIWYYMLTRAVLNVEKTSADLKWQMRIKINIWSHFLHKGKKVKFGRNVSHALAIYTPIIWAPAN